MNFSDADDAQPRIHLFTTDIVALVFHDVKVFLWHYRERKNLPKLIFSPLTQMGDNNS